MATKKRHRPSQALVRRQATDSLQLLNKAIESGNPLIAFAALARDKSVEPAKLQALVALQERIMDRNAKAEFEAAFQAMRPEFPIIDRRGRIVQDGKRTRQYAKHEDIQAAVAPILQRHSFSLRFKTEWPGPNQIRVIAILKHLSGHEEVSMFEGEADKTGDKNATQARGSTISYGRRYATIDVLNLQTKETPDTDGEAPPAKRAPAPKGPKADRPAPPPRAGTDRQDTQVITDAQRKRLWTIASRSGRSNAEVKAWLQQRYEIDSSTKILRRDYEQICNAIEGTGALPEREAGEEG